MAVRKGVAALLLIWRRLAASVDNCPASLPPPPEHKAPAMTPTIGSLDSLLSRLGNSIEDAEEETFLLFSQQIPSQNLGFVDSKASTLDITVAGNDLTIHQSPTVLTSNRPGGTTGAVLWKITPLFAEWLADPENFLFQAPVLSKSSVVLELGCGISGLIGIVLGASVGSYILTDQPYVARFVEENLRENQSLIYGPTARGRVEKRKSGPGKEAADRVRFLPLDWEADQVTAGLTGSSDRQSFDAVVACDCIYNERLIEPLVQTCVDICKLRESDANAEYQTLCIVGQQMRDPDIFEAWMKRFHKSFQAWRVPDDLLTSGLRSNTGFAVHIGVLRDV